MIGKRKHYIDILKFIAVLSVIFCHLKLNNESDINVWFIKCDNAFISRIWYIFGYVFANMSIPMFMLLTGANRFRNTITTSINYKKLINELIKIVIIIIVFQFPFYLYKHIKYGNIFTLSDFIINIYSTNIEPIYWYLPGFLLAFLIVYPLLKKWTIKAEKNDYEYLFIVYVIVNLGVFSVAKYLGIGINVPLNMFTYIYMVPLFGDLICNKYDRNDLNISKYAILSACAIIHFFVSDRYEAMNVYLAMIVLMLFRQFADFDINLYDSYKQSKIYSAITFTAINALMFYILHPYVLKIVFRLSSYIYKSSIDYLDYLIAIIFLIINFIVTFILVKAYTLIANKLNKR